MELQITTCTVMELQNNHVCYDGVKITMCKNVMELKIIMCNTMC